MLVVDGVSKVYDKKKVLDQISFRIEQGHIVGFVGPNGAGKSTMMNIITGYLKASSGEVTMDGISILQDEKDYKKKFGYLPEVPPLYLDMTVWDYLAFVYEAKGIKGSSRHSLMEEVSRVMDLLLISGVGGRVIKNLSKGFKQRIGFAQALLGAPPFLILDEPTIGLDPKQLIQVRNLLNVLKRKHTILLSSHILSQLTEVCDEIIFLYQGKMIAYGSEKELIASIQTEKKCRMVTGWIKDEVLEEVKKLKGVLRCDELGELEEGGFEYEVFYECKEEVQSEMAKVLIGNQVQLYELQEVKSSLEDVFIKLMQKS